MIKNVYLSLIFFILTGCTPYIDTPTPAISVAQAPLSTGTTPTLITTTPANANIPVTTPASTLTPSSTLQPVCPDVGSPEIFDDFQSSGKLQDSILTFLNQGGKLPDLLETMDSFSDSELFSYGADADLNGDGVLEIVITIDILDNIEEDHSKIIVLQCLGGKYEVVFVESGGLFSYLPHPITIVDLNNDSSYEFIIESEIRRSALGWALSIYSWQNGDIVNLFSDTGGEILGNSEWELLDLNGDGIQEVILTGYTIYHPDSGFSRRLIQTFELHDMESYSLISTEYLPPEYRHHALEDAQRALDAGDLSLAVSFYEQAAHDNNLMNIGSYHLGYLDNNTDLPNEYQRAFALFRLLAVQILMEDEIGITATVEELNNVYPEHSPGGEFTTLAQTLRSELESGSSYQEACGEVTRVIFGRFPDLELHIGYWGSRNISYKNETICPFS